MHIARPNPLLRFGVSGAIYLNDNIIARRGGPPATSERDIFRFSVAVAVLTFAFQTSIRHAPFLEPPNPTNQYQYSRTQGKVLPPTYIPTSHTILLQPYEGKEGTYLGTYIHTYIHAYVDRWHDRAGQAYHACMHGLVGGGYLYIYIFRMRLMTLSIYIQARKGREKRKRTHE